MLSAHLPYLEGQLSQLYILPVWLRLQVALQWCIWVYALILNQWMASQQLTGMYSRHHMQLGPVAGEAKL